MKRGVLTVCVLLAGAACAHAGDGTQGIASLAEINGKVLVNSGKGFVPAASLQILNSGDRIFVGNNAFATVAFKDCDVSLSKPTVFTVSAQNPCDQPTVSPVADLPGAGAGIPPVAAVPPLGGLPPLVTGIALAAPVVVVGAVLAAEDDPVSGR